MYRCQVCAAVVPPRTPARRVVTHARAKVYLHRHRVNRIVRLSPAGKWVVSWTDDPSGVGREAVREVLSCPACAGGR